MRPFYCMYLDKPMRDHVLLQAIARVNRPYEDDEGRKKASGFVLDFVGIFDNLEKALAFDSQDIFGIVKDIDVLKERFKAEMEKAKTDYLPIIGGKKQDKAVEALLNYFLDEKIRNEYYKFFKELSAIYEIISPDAFLRDYLDDYETLSSMFRILRENYDRSVDIDKDFTRKTIELVKKHTKSGDIQPALEVFEIDENTLKKIEQSKASDIEKVFNLIKSLERTVAREGETSPYLKSIAEKAEMLVQLFQNRQKTTQETLNELKKIIEEINTAKKEREEKNMTAEIFSIYWILDRAGFENATSMANQMEKVFEEYPHWQKSNKHGIKIRQKLYEVMVQSGTTDTKKISETAQQIMKILKVKS